MAQFPDRAPSGPGLLARFRDGLARTRQAVTARLDEVLGLGVGDEFYQALAETLIQADVGVGAADRVVARVRERSRAGVRTPEALREALAEVLIAALGDPVPLRLHPAPAVILILGVNGSGKTTTIGKLAHRLRLQGRKVLLAAADTFRAAAINQLEVWAERAGVEVVRHRDGADPAAVVFDAAQATRARNVDVLIVDTAGRLHTKANLLDEMKKIDRVLRRELPASPVETLLALDATTGQNGIAQARQFTTALPVTGIVLTKLDGTARGGIVVAIAEELRLPVKLVGMGEGLDDLHPFDARAFVAGLLAPEPP